MVGYVYALWIKAICWVRIFKIFKRLRTHSNVKISLIFKVKCSQVGRTVEILSTEASFSKVILFPGILGADCNSMCFFFVQFWTLRSHIGVPVRVNRSSRWRTYLSLSNSPERREDPVFHAEPAHYIPTKTKPQTVTTGISTQDCVHGNVAGCDVGMEGGACG